MSTLISHTKWNTAAATVALSLVISLCSLIPLNLFAGPESSTKLQERWFFSFGYGRSRQDVDTIKTLIGTASQHGYNGMVLSSFGLDSVTKWKDKDFAMLKEVVECCKENNIELIPTGFSAGYGGGALSHDHNFAAALPATLYLRAGNRHIASPSSENLLVNGNLEDHKGNRFIGFRFHDDPGRTSFADSNACEGKCCIRFENMGNDPHGHGRIMQAVKVKPGHSYRFTFKVKTENLQPLSGFKAMIMAGDRPVASLVPSLKSSGDWQEASLDYINQEDTEVRLYVGIWQGKEGKFWIDDMKFFEYADPSGIVRRKGTPLELKSMDRDKVFVEGSDFAPIQWMRHMDSIRIPQGSAIREGENLLLSCYKTPSVSHSWGEQISLCMSNPDLYQYWKEQAEKLYQAFPYKRYLLAMDEIRNGGGCISCKERGISMAEILGDCITRQRNIFKKINPEIEVMIWSDMLDPAHNARNNYYGIVGDFTGSWKYVPRDISIMCWYHKIRDTSLSFFSGEGFPTYGAAYYDADDLTGSAEWLKSLRKTKGARGIMYTSWVKKYELLDEFGDMVLK